MVAFEGVKQYFVIIKRSRLIAIYQTKCFLIVPSPDQTKSEKQTKKYKFLIFHIFFFTYMKRTQWFWPDHKRLSLPFVMSWIRPNTLIWKLALSQSCSPKIKDGQMRIKSLLLQCKILEKLVTYKDRVSNFSYYTKSPFGLILKIEQFLPFKQHPVTALAT